MTKSQIQNASNSGGNSSSQLTIDHELKTPVRSNIQMKSRNINLGQTSNSHQNDDVHNQLLVSSKITKGASHNNVKRPGRNIMFPTSQKDLRLMQTANVAGISQIAGGSSTVLPPM